MVIHMETKIVTVFGVLDKDGNVTQRFLIQPDQNNPDPLNIQVFNQENFVKAFEAISSVKAQLETKAKELNNLPDANNKPA